MSYAKGSVTLNNNTQGDKLYLDRAKTNQGLYDKLVQNVKYIVMAKGGSCIPCVSVDRFSVINPNLPYLLSKIRYLQAHTLTGKLDGNAWRLSHGNDKDFLPEFNITNKVFANVRRNDRTNEDNNPDAHKMQQFQEYDVRVLLGRESSKEVSDLGAMRVIVDECFEHVYFTIEHYRPTVQGKITVSQKSGKQDIDALSPYIFVLFEPPPLPQTELVIKPKKKSEPGPSATDLLFKDTNITEVKAFGKKQTLVFNGQTVTEIYPACQKRGRSNSFMRELQAQQAQRELEQEAERQAEATSRRGRPPTPLERMAVTSRLPEGGVEQAAMTLGLSPVKAPNAADWNRIKAYMEVHYNVVARP